VAPRSASPRAWLADCLLENRVIEWRTFMALVSGGLLATPLAAEGRPKRAEFLARRFRYNRAAAMQGRWAPLAGDLSVPRSLPESQGRHVGKEDI
jgi:hypothetical protein